MIIHKQPLRLYIIGCLLIFLTLTVPVRAQLDHSYQTSWQNNATGLRTNANNQTGGLGFTVDTTASPRLFTNDGVFYRGWNKLGFPIPIDLGSILPGGAVSLTAQDADWAHNRLSFGSFDLWVSRLSPMLLGQFANTQTVSLFSGDLKTYYDHTLNVLTNGNVCLTPGNGICTTYQSGNIENLQKQYPKYIAYDASGQKTVQQLSTSSTAVNPGENWMLVWFGTNSYFSSTKVPFLYPAYGAIATTVFASYSFQADIPVLLMFDPNNKPTAVVQDTTNGGIKLTFPSSGGGTVGIVPLYGRNYLNAVDTEGWSAGLSAEVSARIDYWKTRLCYFPKTISESYTNGGRTISETVQSTDWINICAGNGIKYLPVPPMLMVAKDALSVQIQPAPAVDTTKIIHTEFGPFTGVENTDSYTWSVPDLDRYVNTKQYVQQGSVPSRLNQALVDQVKKSIDTDSNGQITSDDHLDPWMFPDKLPKNVNTGVINFINPGDSLNYMTMLYPTVKDVLSSNPAEQAQVTSLMRDYLKMERSSFPPESLVNLPLTTGDPQTGIGGHPRSGYVLYYSQAFSQWPIYKKDQFYTRISLYNIYSLAKYYELLKSEEPTVDRSGEIRQTFQTTKTILDADMKEQDWATMYWFEGYESNIVAVQNANRFFSGTLGFIRLSDMAQDTTASAIGHYAFSKAAVLRAALARYPRYQYGNTQDHPLASGVISLPASARWQIDTTTSNWIAYIFNYDWTGAYDDVRQPEILSQFENILFDYTGYDAGNKNVPVIQTEAALTPFTDMTDELARFLSDTVKKDVEVYIDKYMVYTPDWYRAFSASVLGAEHGMNYPGDSYQIFRAKSLIQQDTAANLAQYLNVPWLDVGDFYYLSKLAETIKAYRGWCWSTDGTTCDDGSVITPTPTQPGDTDGDSDVDIFDYNAVITDFGKTGPQGFSVADFDDDGDVDIFDYNVVISNFGR